MENKYRECRSCGIKKLLICFHKNKRSRGGFLFKCKDCRMKKDRTKERTKDGLIKKIYSSQKSTSKKRGHRLPYYNVKELLEWAFSQPIFHKLYDNWVSLDYDKWAKPSFDRNDDYKPYSLSNLTIMTWRDNNTKSHNDMKNGINNKLSISVSQFSLNNEFIKKYYSTNQACRKTGINQSSISQCCIGNYKTAGGFKWKAT